MSKLLSSKNLQAAYIYVTDRCNLKCLHCNVNSSPTCGQFLSLEKLQHFFSSLEYSPDSINITGGEPFLHRDLPEIASICATKVENLSLSTNGLVLRTKMLREIEGKVKEINISLDGDRIAHDEIRGEGTFESTLRNLFVFSEYQFVLNINLTVNSFNIDYVHDFSQELKQTLPISDVRIIGMMKHGRARENWMKIAPSPLLEQQKNSYSDARCRLCVNPQTISLYPDGTLKKCYAEF